MVAQCCVACLIAGPILAFIIGMSTSYATLGPLEAGVLKNTLSQKISSETYVQGRYYIGPMHTFIVFPTTLQTIEFSRNEMADKPPLKISMKGGQNMLLEISFQYRLMPSKLDTLYKNFEVKYADKYVSIAQTQLNNYAVKWTPTQYFQNRIQIGEGMHTVLNTEFKKGYFAVIEHFQFRNIQPPNSISFNIRDKLIQKERGLLAEEKKKAIDIRAQSATIQTTYRSRALIVNSTADKDAQLTREDAKATAIAIKLGRKAEAYKRLKIGLSFNNSDFLKFLYIENIRTARSPDKIVSNLDSAFFSQAI